MIELMEPKTAPSVHEANIAELQERFCDIRPGVIDVLYRLNVESLTEKAGGSFRVFVPDVAQRRTEKQLETFYQAQQYATP